MTNQKTKATPKKTMTNQKTKTTPKKKVADDKDVDLYKILGVAKKSTVKQIRKAFSKLVLKHHPDKNGDQDTFETIQTAYETLVDVRKRRLYDVYGPSILDKPVDEILRSFSAAGTLRVST